MGTKLAEVLRGEFMSLIETLSQEFERKQFKQVNKFETFTLQVENRFAKVSNDVKRAVKLSERVNIQGPSSGIYLAHAAGQQSTIEADQRVNAVKA
jgi:hypothetical protein